MKYSKFFMIFLLSFLPSLVFAGTAYYVDCSAALNGKGTYGSPWNNVASINNYNFDTGDDVYFKAGTTCIMSTALKADWSGTKGDPATIGCYDGKGNFDCSGSRPILDGQNSVPSTSGANGLINKSSGSGLTIEHLKIYRSGDMGILSKADSTTIQDCEISYSDRHGVFVKGDDCLLDNNTITQNAQDNNPTHVANMGALILTGQGSVVTGGTISNNTIFNNYSTEGLSVNRKVNGAIVENNVIYDNKANMGIYLDAAENCTVRYNLIYRSSVSGWSRSVGINVNNENYGYCYTGGHKIYGNLIAACTYGISVGCQVAGCEQGDNLYYNNTIVDSTINNFKFNSGALDDGQAGNVIKDNISWTISAGSAHASNYSPSGFTWDNNNFDDPVNGNAANNAKIYEPPITKKSGWRSIKPGIVNGTELGLQESDPNNLNEVGIISTSENKSIDAPSGLTIIQK